MAKAGLRLSDIDSSQLDIELWPCTQQSINVFWHFRRQWRMGMGGPIALDYGALPAVLRFCEVPRKDWPAVFEDIRTMEIETLNLIAEERH